MLNEKKVVPKLPQEVKVKVDIVTSVIKIYYTEKFQDFTAKQEGQDGPDCSPEFLR